MLGIGIALGLAVLINFIMMVVKFKKGRYADVTVDLFVIIAVSMIYGISIVGGISATFGSLFISIYLHYRPLVDSETSFEEMLDRWDEKIDRMLDEDEKDCK